MGILVPFSRVLPYSAGTGSLVSSPVLCMVGTGRGTLPRFVLPQKQNFFSKTFRYGIKLDELYTVAKSSRPVDVGTRITFQTDQVRCFSSRTEPVCPLGSICEQKHDGPSSLHRAGQSDAGPDDCKREGATEEGSPRPVQPADRRRDGCPGNMLRAVNRHLRARGLVSTMSSCLCVEVCAPQFRKCVSKQLRARNAIQQCWGLN